MLVTGTVFSDIRSPRCPSPPSFSERGSPRSPSPPSMYDVHQIGKALTPLKERQTITEILAELKPSSKKQLHYEEEAIRHESKSSYCSNRGREIHSPARLGEC